MNSRSNEVESKVESKVDSEVKSKIDCWPRHMRHDPGRGTCHTVCPGLDMSALAGTYVWPGFVCPGKDYGAPATTHMHMYWSGHTCPDQGASGAELLYDLCFMVSWSLTILMRFIASSVKAFRTKRKGVLVRTHES